MRFGSALTVVRINGDLDAENAHVLDDAVRAVIVPRVTGAVIVDAAGLDLRDGPAARALDAACEQLAALGHPVSRRDP